MLQQSDDTEGKRNGNGHMALPVENEATFKEPVATVAWMIIFGDAFHNFIDGLSIGASTALYNKT